MMPKDETIDVEASNDPIDVIAALADLIGTENDLLRANRISEIGALQGRKDSLAQRFARSSKRITADRPALIPDDSPERRKYLAALSDLNVLLSENRVLLRKSKALTALRIQAQVEAYRLEQEDGSSYGAGGGAKARGNRCGSPASFFDHSL